MGQTLYEFMKNYVAKESISFHMPGHKRHIFEQLGYGEFINKIEKYDITEIDGADNLHHATTVINESQQKYAKIYGVDQSMFLVNGTTSGIIASILAITQNGDEILMARDCHRAVHSAITLNDLMPRYFYPKISNTLHVSGEYLACDIESMIKKYPKVKCIILPYPNYYGICSNITEIVKVAIKYDKLLIVDEAHGAHLNFGENRLPIGATKAGAHIVINSIHKTLASFTQSSVVHINSDKVDISKLKSQLQMVQSSSPSYLLMTSLDISREIMEEHGNVLMKEWLDAIDWFKMHLKAYDGVKIMEANDEIPLFDQTKINIDMTQLGISGKKLFNILREEYGIYMELAGTNYCMALTGIGTRKKDLQILAKALKDIAIKYKTNNPLKYHIVKYGQVNQVKRPKEVFDGKKEAISISKSIGEIAATSIIPYPPGVPLICPGEEITEEAVKSLQALLSDEIAVIGLEENNEILVNIK